MRNCAVITFLLVAIGLTWGVYQEKRERIARQLQEQISQPSVTTVYVKSKPAAAIPASRELAAVFSDEEP